MRTSASGMIIIKYGIAPNLMLRVVRPERCTPDSVVSIHFDTYLGMQMVGSQSVEMTYLEAARTIDALRGALSA